MGTDLPVGRSDPRARVRWIVAVAAAVVVFGGVVAMVADALRAPETAWLRVTEAATDSVDCEYARTTEDGIPVAICVDDVAVLAVPPTWWEHLVEDVGRRLGTTPPGGQPNPHAWIRTGLRRVADGAEFHEFRRRPDLDGFAEIQARLQRQLAALRSGLLDGDDLPFLPPHLPEGSVTPGVPSVADAGTTAPPCVARVNAETRRIFANAGPVRWERGDLAIVKTRAGDVRARVVDADARWVTLEIDRAADPSVVSVADDVVRAPGPR